MSKLDFIRSATTPCSGQTQGSVEDLLDSDHMLNPLTGAAWRVFFTVHSRSRRASAMSNASSVLRLQLAHEPRTKILRVRPDKMI